MNTEGPTTPPLPPELIVHEVATIFNPARSSISRHSSFPSRAVWTQPYPPFMIWGTKKAMHPIIRPPRAGFSILGMRSGRKIRSLAP